MSIRYVFKDDTQAGMLNMTNRGIHIIGGGDLVSFFKSLGGVNGNDLIVHPIDMEGDQFIEFRRPMDGAREVEDMVEKELNKHGYVLSPRRF